MCRAPQNGGQTGRQSTHNGGLVQRVTASHTPHLHGCVEAPLNIQRGLFTPYTHGCAAIRAHPHVNIAPTHTSTLRARTPPLPSSSGKPTPQECPGAPAVPFIRRNPACAKAHDRKQDKTSPHPRQVHPRQVHPTKATATVTRNNRCPYSLPRKICAMYAHSTAQHCTAHTPSAAGPHPPQGPQCTWPRSRCLRPASASACAVRRATLLPRPAQTNRCRATLAQRVHVPHHARLWFCCCLTQPSRRSQLKQPTPLGTYCRRPAGREWQWSRNRTLTYRMRDDFSPSQAGVPCMHDAGTAAQP